MIRTSDRKEIKVNYDIVKKYSVTLATELADLTKTYDIAATASQWATVQQYITMQDEFKTGETKTVPELTTEKSYAEIFRNATEAKWFEDLAGEITTKPDFFKNGLCDLINISVNLGMNEFHNKLCLCFAMRCAVYGCDDDNKLKAVVIDIGNLTHDEDEPAQKPISRDPSPANSKANPSAIEERPSNTIALAQPSTATASTSALSTGMAKSA